MIKTISYLGLGTMGSGMAANLLKAGYKLTVWNRNPEKWEPFARKGARVADTPVSQAGATLRGYGKHRCLCSSRGGAWACDVSS